MSLITSETIDRIFEAARIEEVIGEFVTLKKAGSNFKGLSPFVNEKTPSFMVSPAKQIFKDFSSGKGGNAVSFLMEHEHFTYPEALRWLAKKYNIEVEEDEQTPEQEKAANERESLYIVSEFAQTFFEEQLWDTAEGKNIGLSYFRERGFTDDIIRKFNMGYSPEERDAFTKKAKAKGYQEEYLTKSGLTISKNNYSFDRFAGRVIFPIHSMSGRVLGFGGRILKSNVKAAKYLNSPESEIYHKSKILYGLYQAKTEISKQDHCYLVEGYTDVVSLYQSGVKNVVASSGTALTKEQINLVKRLTPNLTILYDGDAAGIRASFRGIDLILEEGMNVRVVLFPEGQDPDSFSKGKSVDEIEAFLQENRQDFVRFKTGILTKETDGDPIKKAGIIKDVVQSISLIPDSIMRDVYLKECAVIMDMDEKVLFSELEQLRSKYLKEESKKKSQPRTMEVVGKPKEPQEPQKTRKSNNYIQEEALIKLLLNNGTDEIDIEVENEEGELIEEKETVAEFIIADLVNDGLEFEHPVFKSIFLEFLQAYNEEETILSGAHFTRKPDIELTSLATDLMTEKYVMSDWSKRDIFVAPRDTKLKRFTTEAVLRFKAVKLRGIIEKLQQDLKADTTPEEKYVVLKDLSNYDVFRRQLHAALNRIL